MDSKRFRTEILATSASLPAETASMMMVQAGLLRYRERFTVKANSPALKAGEANRGFQLTSYRSFSPAWKGAL